MKKKPRKMAEANRSVPMTATKIIETLSDRNEMILSLQEVGIWARDPPPNPHCTCCGAELVEEVSPTGRRWVPRY